ncbi:ankyrin repeat domain-containing protein [Pseudanabaena sp. BC1403]|uniref:ankyrin repeat domain-containing protein n=1 Tax=Pseudanabaena sp. BC1403 TaxID=2043171 RepID=UPI000CD83548|nr:ankyrin repeat domain-containing protein [Pseudanabaena sp. BC1403]
MSESLPLIYDGQTAKYFGSVDPQFLEDAHSQISEVAQIFINQGLDYLGKITSSEFANVEIYALATPDQSIVVSLMATKTGLGGIDCVSKFADDSFLTTTTTKVLEHAYDEQKLYRVSFAGASATDLFAQHQLYIEDFVERCGAVQAVFTDLLAIAQMIEEYTIRQQSNTGHIFLQLAGGFAQAQVNLVMNDDSSHKEDDEEDFIEDEDDPEDDGEFTEDDDFDQTDLSSAIRKNNFPLLQRLLEDGADPNEDMEDDYRAIMEAAFHGNLEMVKLLVAYGADVSAWGQGETAIMSAAHGQHQAIYDYLYPLVDAETRRYADKHGQKALDNARKRQSRLANKIGEKLGEAAMYGKLAEVQKLLASGADPNIITECGKSPLMLAAMYGHKNVISALLKAGTDPNLAGDEEFDEGMTALMYIASSFFASNRAEVIKFLVEHGANVDLQNDKGKTALMVAGENTDAVKALIEMGANLDLRDNEGNTAMMSGSWSVQGLLRRAGASEEGLNDVALVEASRNGNLIKVEELIQAGANVNYRDGRALVAAAGEGHLDIVDRLIRAGADVNLGWKSGFTPIASAAYRGYLNVVQKLLAEGANPFQRTHDDEFDDALDYARRGQYEGHHKERDSDYTAIIELLESQSKAAMVKDI